MRKKFFEYREFPQVVTCYRQVCLNVGRLTFSACYMPRYIGPLKWFKITGPSGPSCARWSRCVWFHRVGFGLAWDFIGLNAL